VATILITGANKGLGREAARCLIADGHDVWATARDRERGRVVAAELGARPLVLDVTDDASVNAAVEAVSEATGGVLDVLVNNAGIPGGAMSIRDLTAAHFVAVYEVNVLGAVRMLHAFLPLLERSATPVVVNVSSGLGSLTIATDPHSPLSKLIIPTYRSAKAALNMLTIQYAKALPTIRINSVNPGFTATDFTHNRGQTVERGAEVIVRMATIGPDGPTGSFVDQDGVVPW
jgi:NAD(P)-dependent dehydrogenase (short-subunit alcohol dehydrogenase family)